MKLFISADIHGHFDEWQSSLIKQGFDIKNKSHKILLNGDIFDRGRQPKQIIDFILSIKDRIIIVKGNHESLMEMLIARNKSDISDLFNGTSQTIVDLYPEWLVSEFDLSKIAKVTRLQEILDMCVYYYETKKYIFVHSWIPVLDNIEYDKNWRNASKERLEQSRWRNPLIMTNKELFEPNKKIVFGHWHCSAFWHRFNPSEYEEFGDKANFEPFITDNYIAMDTCAIRSNKVNVLVIEDEEL